MGEIEIRLCCVCSKEMWVLLVGDAPRCWPCEQQHRREEAAPADG